MRRSPKRSGAVAGAFDADHLAFDPVSGLDDHRPSRVLGGAAEQDPDHVRDRQAMPQLAREA
ncbi:hypothetical protein [Streptomyces erythrochromogenes]|uniref:hypothetical protein n=1 Tax=Streptomyces erythrochromogenes TaxID=285574 RepID=UPI0037F71FC3